MRRGTRHNGARSRQAKLWALSGLVVTGVALVAGLWRFLGTPTPSGAAGPNALPRGYAAVVGPLANLPAGRVYFVARQAQGFTLMRSDVAGASVAIAPLPAGFGAEASDSVAALALAPGGRYLALDAQRDHGDTVYIITTASGALRLAPDDAMGNFLRWLPDGQHFLFRPFIPAGPVVTAWSPGIWIVDAATGQHVNLPLPDGLTAQQVVDAAPTPDGARLIFSVSYGLGTGSAVWEAGVDGTGARELFTTPTVAGLFAWSPDGTRVAYEQLADTPAPYRPAGLWLLDATTLTRSRIATADGGHGFMPAWSPDGTRVAFVDRLNSADPTADQMAGRLVSAVGVVDLTTGQTALLAGPDQTGQPRNVDPQWRSDGALRFTTLAASDGPGAAQSGAALWLATPGSTGNGRAFLVTPLAGASFAGAVALVSVGG